VGLRPSAKSGYTHEGTNARLWKTLIMPYFSDQSLVPDDETGRAIEDARLEMRAAVFM
jgi:hypothetical protein